MTSSSTKRLNSGVRLSGFVLHHFRTAGCERKKRIVSVSVFQRALSRAKLLLPEDRLVDTKRGQQQHVKLHAFVVGEVLGSFEAQPIDTRETIAVGDPDVEGRSGRS